MELNSYNRGKHYSNNIFNTSYSEKDFVAMPKGNMLFGVNYRLN